MLLRKFVTFRSDLDPNLFDSCSAPEPDLDLDPIGHENQDPDPNKVGYDPQHCSQFKIVFLKMLISPENKINEKHGKPFELFIT